jgi:hypothetical protein
MQLAQKFGVRCGYYCCCCRCCCILLLRALKGSFFNNLLGKVLVIGRGTDTVYTVRTGVLYRCIHCTYSVYTYAYRCIHPCIHVFTYYCIQVSGTPVPTLYTQNNAVYTCIQGVFTVYIYSMSVYTHCIQQFAN